MVETFGDQFLARAALADHEHRAVQRRSPARALDGIEERQALADKLVRAFHSVPIQKLADCWWQIPPFGKEFRLVFPWKSPLFPYLPCFRESGTALVW